MEMSSNKPYLMRAVYEWLVDNQATPHIVILADREDVNVPMQFVEDGKIVLNISPNAAQNVLIDNEAVSFNARFSGKPFSIYAPLGAVVALYARENGEGMLFEAEEPEQTPPETTPPGSRSETQSPVKSNSKGSSKRPSLKVVK